MRISATISAFHLLIILCLPVFAQDAKLIADGKKEGKVVIYGSMEQNIFEGVRQSFASHFVWSVNQCAKVVRF